MFRRGAGLEGELGSAALCGRTLRVDVILWGVCRRTEGWPKEGTIMVQIIQGTYLQLSIGNYRKLSTW